MRFASANSWRCNDKADLWEISCVLRDPVQFAAVRAELSARIATGDAVGKRGLAAAADYEYHRSARRWRCGDAAAISAASVRASGT
jgi:hypothetical protein